MDDTKQYPTAAELLQHLKETGTGLDRVAQVERFLEQRPEATAPEVLEHMVASNVPLGTIRKSGAFIYGVAFYMRAPGQSDADAMKSLLQEKQRLQERVRELELEHCRLQAEHDRLSAELRDLEGAAGQR